MKNNAYWFYLEQFVYFVKKNNNILIYNELNGCFIEYNDINDPDLLNIVIRIDLISDNNRVIEISESELSNAEVEKFINKLRGDFSGDLLPKVNAVKPFVLSPYIDIVSDVEFMHIDEEYLLSYRLKTAIRELTINTGINKSISKNKNVFKEVSDGSKFEVYDYLNSIAKEVSGFPSLRQLNLICYRDTLFDKIQLFLDSLSDLTICLHVEVENFYTIIDSIKGEYIYYLYLRPNEHDFKFLADLYVLNQYTIVPVVGIENDNDILSLNNLSTSYSFDYNTFVIIDNNVTFIEDNFSRLRADIIETKPSMQEIFINGIINKNIFGKVYINEVGDISSLRSEETQLNIKNNSITDFAYNQLKYKMDWFLVRSTVPKCNDCIFCNLCPPISSHEILLGKYDLCSLK